MLLALLLLAASPENEIEYESYAPPRYEVYAFMATACPMAKLSVGRLNDLADRYPQVHFQGISANGADTDTEIAEFGKRLRFHFRRDRGEIVKLGATRSPEVFLLLSGDVVYQGRIDDQYAPGANRAQATRSDLEEAIQEVIAGKPVSVSKTKATGCRITMSGQHGGEITYQHVAAILHTKCASCHRPGEVAPFPLLTYKDAKGWTAMIREVISNQRMPPWSADAPHGTFSNDLRLTDRETELLVRWIDSGAPPSEHEMPTPKFREGWQIEPDLVLTIDKPFNVPAEGVIDYQDYALDPQFDQDTWVDGIQIRPGNKAVVHHVNVYLKPKGAAEDLVYFNAMEDLFFTVMVPGNSVTAWPPGIAKVVPAGWDIVLSIHYQPNGSPQSDQTSIAIQFADPAKVQKQIATRAMIGNDFLLPANQVTTLTNTWMLEEDFTIHALMPHMHLRGKSMRVEADGEVLLTVPQFDFNWQHRYVFATPRPLKKGTVIRCIAEYDNTTANPNNPNPNVDVRAGRQSTDEMFQLNVEITRTHEDRTRPRTAMLPLLAVLTLAFIGRCFKRTA